LSIFIGNTSANENVSENNASDEKTERYNELYYEQKSTVDLFEQNGLPTNNRDGEMKDDIDLSEFDNVSFSKLIKNRNNSTNHLRERNGTSEKVVHTDEGVNKPGELNIDREEKVSNKNLRSKVCSDEYQVP
jgi:hypothetical protein